MPTLMPSVIRALGLTFGLALAPMALADAQPTAVSSGPETVKGRVHPAVTFDHKVLAKIHLGNTLEIHAATVGIQKAQKEAVRAYAARIEREHGAADADAEQLASTHGISFTQLLATDPMAAQKRREHEQAMAGLAPLSGADFDRAFMDMMVKDHEDDVRELQAAQASLREPDVKTFVGILLATISDHLADAKRLRASL